MSVDHLWEVYNIAYRTLSASTHAGALSFVRDEIRLRRDGTHLAPRAPWDGWSLRALGVPTITMLLATVSRQVGLGVEAECDAVRLAVVFPMS